MTDGPTSDDRAVLARLAELERRVADLESGHHSAVDTAAGDIGHATTDASAGASAGPAVGTERSEPAGVVRYAGQVHLHGDVTWELALDVATALDLPDEPRVTVLAALGHPARARIVRSLLADGPRATSALQEAAGLASTGQLYHHLRALTHSGLVEQDGRGTYRIGARAIVPALVLLTAAADVAGQLR